VRVSSERYVAGSDASSIVRQVQGSECDLRPKLGKRKHHLSNSGESDYGAGSSMRASSRRHHRVCCFDQARYKTQLESAPATLKSTVPSVVTVVVVKGGSGRGEGLSASTSGGVDPAVASSYIGFQ
jgi:hypothetical protein